EPRANGGRYVARRRRPVFGIAPYPALLMTPPPPALITPPPPARVRFPLASLRGSKNERWSVTVSRIWGSIRSGSTSARSSTSFSSGPRGRGRRRWWRGRCSGGEFEPLGELRGHGHARATALRPQGVRLPGMRERHSARHLPRGGGARPGS